MHTKCLIDTAWSIYPDHEPGVQSTWSLQRCPSCGSNNKNSFQDEKWSKSKETWHSCGFGYDFLPHYSHVASRYYTNAVCSCIGNNVGEQSTLPEESSKPIAATLKKTCRLHVLGITLLNICSLFAPVPCCCEQMEEGDGKWERKNFLCENRRGGLLLYNSIQNRTDINS